MTCYVGSKDCVTSQGWHSADNMMALPAFCVTIEEVEQGICKSPRKEKMGRQLEKQTFEVKQMRNNIENSHKYVVLLQHFPTFSSQNALPLYKMGRTQNPLPCSPNVFTSESRVKDYLHATALLKYSFFFVPTHLVTCFNRNIPVPITEAPWVQRLEKI